MRYLIFGCTQLFFFSRYLKFFRSWLDEGSLSTVSRECERARNEERKIELKSPRWKNSHKHEMSWGIFRVEWALVSLLAAKECDSLFRVRSPYETKIGDRKLRFWKFSGKKFFTWSLSLHWLIEYLHKIIKIEISDHIFICNQATHKHRKTT